MSSIILLCSFATKTARSAGNKKSSIILLHLIVTLSYHFLNNVLIYQMHVIFGWSSSHIPCTWVSDLRALTNSIHAFL